MGTVYRAFDQILEEEIALKIILIDQGKTDELARRFRSEIKLARKVRHKNVCAIHDYGEDGPLQYISMELVEGVNLRQLLDVRGRLPPEEAFDVSLQICQGLQAIHDAKIIHRDLKPQNLMVQPDGVIRLMDFGIAKRMGPGTTGHTRTGQIIGTPEYMSPEQGRGEKVNSSSDLYTAGIVMFEIFTGTVPFHGDTPVATIMKHVLDPPPLDGGVARSLPPGLVRILRNLLAKNASERLDISELVLQLATLARTSEVATVRDETTMRLSVSRLPVSDATVTLQRTATPVEPTPQPKTVEAKVIRPPPVEVRKPTPGEKPSRPPSDASPPKWPSTPIPPRARQRGAVPVTRSYPGRVLAGAGLAMMLVTAGVTAFVYSSGRAALQGGRSVPSSSMPADVSAGTGDL